MDDGSAGARMQMSLIRADEPAVPVAIMAPTVHRPNEQFTALLHHINPETLRLAFNALKKGRGTRSGWNDLVRLRGRP